MGLAWLDDAAPDMGEAALRVGGLPLLTHTNQWPDCPRCENPMLFRAQVPLALTSLVAATDSRLLAFFECHAIAHGTPCDGSLLHVCEESGVPVEPPPCTQHDLLLLDPGPDPRAIASVAQSLSMRPGAESLPPSLVGPRPSVTSLQTPMILLSGMPTDLSLETLDMLQLLGARVGLLPTAPTLMPMVRGGRLVPFDDGHPGSHPTTLPPLGGLDRCGKGTLRGLIGGATPGYRDYAFPCPCGRNTRTAVRLLADSDEELPLGPAIAQFCAKCGSGTLHRCG